MAVHALHQHWYRRLLIIWLFTGPPMLVLSNFQNPDWFSILPGAPPLSEGTYPTVAWTLIVLIIWHPLLLLPFALWPAIRRRKLEDNNAKN